MSDYRIALYIRLSQADEETGKEKDESNSITHQRMLLYKYIKNSLELDGSTMAEFVDDGFSGTNTSRPSFQRMIGEIRSGMYNLVIVKDFSRFSRDYIEAGDYMECVFPFLGVRFISVNDGYDSNNYQGTTGGLDVVMRNIIYAAYSKDLSVKVKTAKEMRRRKGEYIETVPPIGYIKDPNDKHKLIIDEEGADIVRRIFMMAIEGERITAIAKKLNEGGVITPTEYYERKKPGTKQHHSTIEARWSYSSVYVILTRYTYTGAIVTNVRKSGGVGSKKWTKQDRNDWIVLKNKHEPIVTEQEFEQAQKVIFKKKVPKKSAKDYPLKSLVRCGCCGRIARRRSKGYGYTCRYAFDSPDSACAKVSFSTEQHLDNIIFDAIKDQIALADASINKVRAGVRKKDTKIQEIMDTIAEAERQIEHIKNEKLHGYEEYALGNITKERYLKEKSTLDQQLAAIHANIETQKAVIKGLEQDVPDLNRTAERADCFREQETLTNEMAKAFIEAVYIQPDGSIKIKWKFDDIFAENVGKEG